MTQHGRKSQRRLRGIVITCAVIIAVAVVAVTITLSKRANQTGPLPVHLPATPESYLGVYASGVPASYSGVTAFKNSTGAAPDVVMYYSGWYEPFQERFAAKAAKNGEVPLVQMDPEGPHNVGLAGVASGRYDGYLSAYAEAVRAYGNPVIISFGHEMNGSWYPWGYTHASPKTFVAAWRHVVSLFRSFGAKNVTWLWTVNIINNTHSPSGTIPSPARWWPGASYVNWVGIDGYYLKQSWQFAPLFGPTITAVRQLTGDPILIAETGASPESGKPAKIADVFSGVHHYGLLGVVWFDSINSAGVDFRVSTPAAEAAFGRGASNYTRPAS